MKSLICNRRALAVFAISFVGLPLYGQTTYEALKMTASDGEGGDMFGRSLSISGTTAIVGADGDHNGGVVTGSAYLFDITSGQQLFKLMATDAGPLDLFGFSVGISGTTAIVGARFDDDAGPSSGSAYLFDAITGEQVFKLVADDAAEQDQFGWSVAISGTTAIVGARQDDDGGAQSGSAYSFDTITGEQLFKLTASDAFADDRFGTAVAISGNIAIVGAPRNDGEEGENSGAAYLFDTTTGEQLFRLVGTHIGEGSFFGTAVAISGSRAVVMGRLISSGNAVVAHVFDTNTGEQVLEFTGPGDLLSTDVAMSGTKAIVGRSGFNDFIFDDGSAVVFDVMAGQQIAHLRASDAEMHDQLGASVGISGTISLAGAMFDDDAGTSSGSAYVFNLCPVDINRDGSLNFMDVNVFLAAFASGDLNADFNGDSHFNFFDVSLFLEAFAAGCP